MKVKIKKCKHKRWWYKDMIGQEFEITDKVHMYGNSPVVSINNGKIIFIEDCNYKNIVRKEKLKRINNENL